MAQDPWTSGVRFLAVDNSGACNPTINASRRINRQEANRCTMWDDCGFII